MMKHEREAKEHYMKIAGSRNGERIITKGKERIEQKGKKKRRRK